LLNNDTKILTDLKIRASWGILGDDTNPYVGGNPPIVSPYAYLPGYTYGLIYNPDGSTTNLTPAILDGNSVTVARDKGVPTTNITWLKSYLTDIGVDFSLLRGKLTGSFDYFYRKRTGLLGSKNDVLTPLELGYILPQENINSDAQYGGEFALGYNGKLGRELLFNVTGNFSITRSKSLETYNPLFFNSLDQYYNSIEDRLNNKTFGYTVIGQFKSMDEINNYPVNIDGQGNRTLLPGDLIYKDFNGDSKIDNNDARPIGYGYGSQPTTNFGLSIGLAYKGFDFHADFSGAAGYTWFQNWEMRWAFQNNGNLNKIFTDRWHRADIFDPNSEWIPGKYPANRFNPGNSHSDYSSNSTFWLHNVTQFRARTIEIGYTLPANLTQKAKIQKARFYLNVYNAFSIDNLSQYGIDPEVIDDNGLQFPQNRVINIGTNISF
jgi:hypothetical protein